MGLATAINFQPTGNRRAAIAGDFVMIASEVNPVIRALRAGGIVVTVEVLGTALRSALDRMHIKK